MPAARADPRPEPRNVVEPAMIGEPVPRRRERVPYRRALGWGLLASAALHVLLLLGWRTGAPGAPREGRAEGPERPRAVRSALRVHSVRARERVAIPPPPAPVPATAEPDVAAPRASSLSLAAAELEPRSYRRPGRGDGSGDEDAALTPPVPRSVSPEWSPPPEVRGREVTIRVHVDASGVPTGPVELRPPTPSQEFNRRLIRSAREMRFTPARRDGRPVAAWAELTYRF